jgi:hypothetical protein
MALVTVGHRHRAYDHWERPRRRKHHYPRARRALIATSWIRKRRPTTFIERKLNHTSSKTHAPAPASAARTSATTPSMSVIVRVSLAAAKTNSIRATSRPVARPVSSAYTPPCNR